MDGDRFDAFTRALGSGRSRRGVLKGLAGAALGAVAAASGLETISAAARKRAQGAVCSKNADCQSGSCLPKDRTGRRYCGSAGCPKGTMSCNGACQACCFPSDCPGQDGECQSRTCTNGVCGVAHAPSGTTLAAQTAGDCQRNVCDGAGGTTSVADNADLPADDGNQCTSEACVGGVPSHPATAAGSPCSQGGGTVCDGAGMCVSACVPSCSSANVCGDDGCGGTCSSDFCSAIDCNTAFCDGGACYYNSNPDAQGTACNSGTGTCDNLGNCVANPGGPGTCPANSDYCATGVPVTCNGAGACHCYGTSTGALFCGLGSNNACADCNVDADCVGLGVGSACVDLGTHCSSCGSNTPTHVCMAPCTA